MSVWPGRLARAGSGLLVLGLAGAVGVASWLAPLPEDVEVGALAIPVPAGPTTLVCPGPVVLPDAEDEGDPEFNPAPVGSRDRLRIVAGAGGKFGDESGPGDGDAPTGEDGTALDDSRTDDDAPGGSVGSDRAPSVVPGAVLETWPLDRLSGAPTWVADASGITADLRGSTDGSAVGETLAVSSGEHTSALVARAQPVVELSPRVAGAVVSTVTAGDLRGSTAAACQSPASEFWLVGGGTELGTTTLLVVHNPGATTAEIGLEMWGPTGAVDLGGGARYLVPSGRTLTLRLSALAPELARTVVRVTSAGGQVAAYLQVSELDGFTPGGSDLVVPGVGPASRQVIPSVVVPESELGDGGAGLLRLLVAGVEADGAEADAAQEGASEDGDAQGGASEDGDSEDGDSEDGDAEGGRSTDSSVRVRVEFYGESGPVVLPGTEDLNLVPGEVTDVDLGGLPAGAYAVVIYADAPLLAGARVARLGSSANAGEPVPVEQAWIAASSVGSIADLVAVPAGLISDVVVSAVPAGDAPPEDLVAPIAGQLRAFDELGAVMVSEPVAVPAGATLRVPLPQGVAAVELIRETASPDGSAPADGAVPTAGTSLTWGVLATARGSDGEFISVLVPPVHGAAVGEVAVRRGQRLPLE